jgi:hypothetical protein
VLERLPLESLQRLREITRGNGLAGSAEQRSEYASWVERAIAPRNIGGFCDPAREHLYPADLDLLVERHGVLGMTREQVLLGITGLRGRSGKPQAPSACAHSSEV